MLFRQDALDKIRDGRISVVFRRWERARVVVGSRLRTIIGVVEVKAVDRVSRISAADAKRAGYPTVAAATADVPARAGDLFRVEVRFAGADPRVVLRHDLSGLDDVIARLDRMDATSTRGPWTRAVLGLIAAHPAVRAGDLWAQVGYPDMPTFKRDVRRLKELGLTESLEIGYRLSPRGAAAIARMVS